MEKFKKELEEILADCKEVKFGVGGVYEYDGNDHCIITDGIVLDVYDDYDDYDDYRPYDPCDECDGYYCSDCVCSRPSTNCNHHVNIINETYYVVIHYISSSLNKAHVYIKEDKLTENKKTEIKHRLTTTIQCIKNRFY